ncbi:OadG family protein [Desemzia sp. RIT804]|uniref:OadG family protein n=1 Tax=Desemzia sp. RIT 804 TaxID=2810209 RepID=UPI00194DD2EC|nr:OadG family protein [Desemzia sp. RIT 804]MBM6614261.1 OadG family protein [Desemzia sp. RIT 804]
MENFTIMDGVVVTVISMLVVFLVLIGLQFVISLFRIIIERQKGQQFTDSKKMETPQQSNGFFPSKKLLEEDEETKTVAALMALILANEDQQDKYYQVTSIKRIR